MVVAAVVIAAFWFLIAAYNDIQREKVSCLQSGGKWTTYYKRYVCVHPSPSESR